ncbi:MAG: DUF4271 domain-containing protein [Flavobacteriales bacterium]|nr:DUF4271 domain-containing protein [Flavobacteriales bacterium]
MIEGSDSLKVIESVVPYNGSYSNYMNYSEFVDQVSLHQAVRSKENSFFAGNSKPQRVETWMIFVLLFGYLCLAFSRAMHRKRFSMLFKTLINWKLSKQIIRYEKVYTHPVNVLMIVNFVLCFPFFFSLARNWTTEINEPVIWTYILFIIPLLGYFLIKIVIYKFSGWLFDKKDVIEEYVFQTNLFNKYLGLAFLILTTLLLFAPIDPVILSYIGFTTLLLGLIFQITRGVMIGLENGVGLFFIIAYLCTLEITPWLILGKWIKISL